ncbi:putative bifunctional DNA primase/polymerase [Actinoplanes missouriensis 431]|uniref:Putative bifunctional DNA primase/polymerase n=1 Tax=Actinoplanes missouriensis (strain ATCC 14538 / DSM 43046 / CBS 188.64 / JCM 3121 / NBRC 102363 / NCIMB 12654 / NRRL B-3342 / UNCC 431) TaxID=512565 RepID=I0H0K7_ACTM4|nr:bifunctional DNA primase/polymerase [Actinoplanes missouriensis]BAL86544.1 putative bifunctional DNA primase/polymerase [Actinoplanes missouriensis 431]
MQWTSRQPFVPPALLDRLDRVRLRRAALRYAAHGWDVTPGAYLTGRRFDCGRPGCTITGCHPALDSWAESATGDPVRIAAWWRRQAHTVLLPTGVGFDVLEVPASLGRRVTGLEPAGTGPVAGIAAGLGPVADTSAGRWMFLVSPGRALRPELEHRLDVIRHGLGSWIPAPPNRMLDGSVRWIVPPEQVQWRLPDADRVQELLVAAARPRSRPVIPRQVSTSRRAA